MIVKTISLLAFILQVVFGHLCMMDMASAQDMGNMHHACDNCSPKANEKQQIPMDQSGCGDGHCLMHANISEQIAFQTADPSYWIALPVSPAAESHATSVSDDRPVATAPPDTPSKERNDVLLC